MAKRKEPFITSSLYHIYNRGVEKRSTFGDGRDYARFAKTLAYYLYHHPTPKFSEYVDLFPLAQQIVDKRRTTLGTRGVRYICYVFMPNHFHILVEQITDHGITRYLQDITNSYTRYFNTRHRRVGPLFQGPFKAVRIESDEQLLHVSRYIHLNPFSSRVVSSLEDAYSYPWSSIQQYLRGTNGICDTHDILTHFTSRYSYRKFLEDNADYQRNLEFIKHIKHE